MRRNQYWFACVNRDTGAESTETVVAETKDAAMETLSNRGFIVGKVLNEMEVTIREAKRPRGAGESVIGLLLIALGVGVVIFAFLMDTSVETGRDAGFGRVHNIGLMNRQLMVAMIGCATVLGGLMYRTTGAILNSLSIKP